MKRLTIEREKRGLSRAELARRAGMGAGDVGKIENGRIVAYRAQLVKLGRAMRMRVPEALTLGDEVATAESAAAEVEHAAAGVRAICDAIEADDPRQTTVSELLERSGSQ